MNKLPILSISDFAEKCCYSPTKYLSNDWQGNALDILNVEECPVQDRVYVVTRCNFLNDKVLRLFAIDCARNALSKVKNPDKRSIAAVDIAEKFANGEATIEELRDARDVAYAAYDDATAAAAHAAAYTAAAAHAAAYTAAAAHVNTAAAHVNTAADAAAHAAADVVTERNRQIEVLKDLIAKHYEV